MFLSAAGSRDWGRERLCSSTTIRAWLSITQTGEAVVIRRPWRPDPTIPPGEPGSEMYLLARLGAQRAFMLGIAAGVLLLELFRYTIDWSDIMLAGLIAVLAVAVPRVD